MDQKNREIRREISTKYIHLGPLGNVWPRTGGFHQVNVTVIYLYADKINVEKSNSLFKTTSVC